MSAKLRRFARVRTDPQFQDHFEECTKAQAEKCQSSLDLPEPDPQLRTAPTHKPSEIVGRRHAHKLDLALEPCSLKPYKPEPPNRNPRWILGGGGAGDHPYL